MHQIVRRPRHGHEGCWVAASPVVGPSARRPDRAAREVAMAGRIEHGATVPGGAVGDTRKTSGMICGHRGAGLTMDNHQQGEREPSNREM